MPDVQQSSSSIDRAGAVRPGEELQLDTLLPWLQQNVDRLEGQPHITQYSGGVSNWTYCLSFTSRDIILRRAPEGTKAKGAHDMGREYRLQKALKPVYPLVPTVLGYCDDPTVMNSEFYVMEKLTGIIPRKNLPRSVSLSNAQTRELCEKALDGLIDLHKVDYKQAGLDNLGKGEGYTQRQIEGWSQRYRNVKTWNVPSARLVIDWLADNLPEKEHICITHNDYRFDNLVLNSVDPTKIIGVLDWELATLGDPLMDLGNMLAYWVEAQDDWLAQQTRRQPTHLPGMMTRNEVIDYYAARTGRDIRNFTFYQVYGLFRLAAIAQQIYYRYHHKQTRNPAYKHYWIFVHYLLRRCSRLIKQQH